MNEFMMIFRHPVPGETTLSPEQLQAGIELWQNWIGGIAAQGKFVSTNQLGFQGKTLRPGRVVTDGPYAEVKEMVGGYVIVKAASLQEAADLAEGCPILAMGGHVEVRDIMKID
ncbi:YciI family protein [Chitinophaga sp.]|uniref:YciI family protein n=1 Tax=Chitinophaga sp. TaxID=1869181 RepID=UPI0031DBC08E